MKKLLTLILAILYMASSTGATFHMHYCMGKLVEVKLWHKEAPKCSKCGAEPKSACAKKCCKDEHKTVKLEKDQRTAENVLPFIQLPAIFLPVTYLERPEIDTLSLLEEFPVSNAPPRSGKVHTHILNCTFRI
jgi:hypothetical protein